MADGWTSGLNVDHGQACGASLLGSLAGDIKGIKYAGITVDTKTSPVRSLVRSILFGQKDSPWWIDVIRTEVGNRTYMYASLCMCVTKQMRTGWYAACSRNGGHGENLREPETRQMLTQGTPTALMHTRTFLATRASATNSVYKPAAKQPKAMPRKLENTCGQGDSESHERNWLHKSLS